MATRPRVAAPAGKEKRSTTNTSKTISPVRKQADPTLTTTSLNKNVPSYLKPTAAQAKKSASSSDLNSTNSTKTSNLPRRRSFDNKPPLPSSSPETRISPSPRERTPRSSSSLSTKTSTSHRPLLDKSSKTTTSKDVIGKQRGAGLNVRPVTNRKTSTTTSTTRKHDSASGSTTKASLTTNSVDIAQDVISQGGQSEPENHHELTIHETEKETITIDNELIADSDAAENENDDSAVEDHVQEHINENANSAELEDIKAPAESSTIVENPEIKTEEPEEISNEPDSPEKEKVETIINASSEDNQESKEVDEGINEGKETPVAEETKAVQQEQQQSLSPKQVAVSIEESTKAEPVKHTIAASAKPQHQVVQGKNKESVVSNNVIEETASKLREQRRNKVKALAGAFETVISLQEHK
ncbi:hypothetical protein HAX54_009052 [Datura stramonium]|uniref:Calmodulin-binding domain-containing protein n=1 Tax=Datura stramonium TaxID=4076 RepID=A0ABS8TG28_DATST|nr:hypothetical protein [Datura stramonium]